MRGGKLGTPTAGRRATSISQGTAVIDLTISHPPLEGDAGPLNAAWWQRGPLSAAQDLPVEPAVYVVYDQATEVAVYIGETNQLRPRAVAHAASRWPVGDPWLAYLSLPAETPKHVLRELESDLLGWHFWHTGRAPIAQYLERSREVGEAVPL